jgi:hypothetical protein
MALSFHILVELSWVVDKVFFLNGSTLMYVVYLLFVEPSIKAIKSFMLCYLSVLRCDKMLTFFRVGNGLGLIHVLTKFHL